LNALGAITAAIDALKATFLSKVEGNDNLSDKPGYSIIQEVFILFVFTQYGIRANG
jgi:hypothetical protein